MSSHTFVMDNTTRGLLALSQSLLDLNDTDIAPTPPTPNLSDYVLPSFLNDHDTAQCDSPDPQDQSASSFLNLDDRTVITSTPVRLVTPTPDSSTASTLDNSSTFQVPKVLKFIRGRNGGTQSTYGGFVYTFDRKKDSGVHYWQCKDHKQYTPFCTGRLYTKGRESVIREKDHNHEPSETGVIKSAAISKVMYDTSSRKCNC